VERLTFVDANPRHETDPVAVAECGGFRVKIVRDVLAVNPWEAGDSEPPLAVASYGYGGSPNVTFYDSAGGAGLLDPFARFSSDALLRRHMQAIARALDIDPADVDCEARQQMRDYGGNITDIKRDIFIDVFHGMRAGDQFDAAAALYALLGIEALSTCSRGYSQGDYVDLLLVATPEWAAKVGAPRDSHACQLKHAAELYGAWAWGDVYGYVIEDSDGEHVDSCFGFYTSDPTGAGFEESGMAEYAMPSLKSAIRERFERQAREIEAARPDMYSVEESTR